jgi:hypothetical protein
MKALCCHITIANYTFTGVYSCVVETSTRSLADKATIELPISAVFENSKRLNISSKIARGDKVVIELGYDDDFTTEFKGWVENVAVTTKTVITCENDAFLLRKNIDNKIFKGTNLKEIIDYAISGLGITLNSDIPTISLDGFIIKNSTAIGVLEKIKQQYGLTAFFDIYGKLYIGLAYVVKPGEVTINLDTCPDDNSDLKFIIEEDMKVKVKAVSIQKDNSKIEVETGDSEGDLRTLTFYNISDKAQIKKLADEELKKFKFTGYKGKITTFGWPISKKSMTVILKDKNYPDREGSYYADSVKTTFAKGYRREIELGVKI